MLCNIKTGSRVRSRAPTPFLFVALGLTITACGRGGFVEVAHGVALATSTCTKLAAPPTTDVSGYDYPANSTLGAAVSFATDWSRLAAAGGFAWAQVIDACRLHPDASLTTNHGLTAVRVEVDPMDDPLALGDNTERAEVAQMQTGSGVTIEESSASGIQFYAFSYFFPSDWAGTQYPWSVFESPGTSWPHGFSSDCSAGSGSSCNSWSVVLQFHGYLSLNAAATTVGGAQQYVLYAGQAYAFADGGAVALGKWTDFVLRVDWSTGAFSLWRRDEDEATFSTVVTGVAGAPACTTIFKQGLYRGGAVNGRTDVLWMGPTARGTTFAAVEDAAFGTSDGP